MEKLSEIQKKYCSLFSCFIGFAFITLLFLSISLLCLILFQVEMNNENPLLITSDDSYSSNSTILLACIYPARNFAYQPTDQSCVDFPTFYCPALYECTTISNSNIPACYSEQFTCGNSTFCYNFINDLDYTSDNIAKILDLDYSEGWIVMFYIFSILIFIIIIIAIPIVIIFRNKINWEHNNIKDIDDGTPVLYNSYSEILGEGETEKLPWSSRDILTSSIIGGIGCMIIFLVGISIGILAGTMDPSLPNLDELEDYNCINNDSVISAIRWRITMTVLFSICSLFTIGVITILILAISIPRIYIAVWNIKACCYLWGIVITILVALAILSIIVIVT